MLLPIQVKLARTALGWGVRELAGNAGVAPSTIVRFEAGRGGMQAATLDRVERCLRDGGIMFVDPDATGGPGVRLKE